MIIIIELPLRTALRETSDSIYPVKNKMNIPHHLSFVGLCLVVTLSQCRAKYQMADMRPDSERMSSKYDGKTIAEYTNDIRKRAGITKAAQGLVAMEKILTGSQRVRTTKRSRLYRKIGNRETALKDFYSVKPVVADMSKIRKWDPGLRSVDMHIGTVGDRRFILMLDGDKNSKPNPVLEIRSATDALYDRIVYKTE